MTRLASVRQTLGPTCSYAVAASFFFGSLSAFAAPVVLPVDGLDTADVNYGAYIADCGGGFSCIPDAASLGPGGGADHLDDALGVTINGTAYGVSGGDLTGNTLTLDTVSIGQFDVFVSLQSNGPVMRQIVTVTNTGIAGNALVMWHNNTGNDVNQRTIGTSDGDLLEELTDRWVVTADANTGIDNEVNAWILYGPDGPSVTTSTLAMVDGAASFGGTGEEGISAGFNLDLGAGETAALMWFLGLEGINQDAIDLAGQFDDTSTSYFQGLIADLSQAERSQIKNWVIPEPGTLFLAALAGILPSVKRRRRGR